MANLTRQSSQRLIKIGKLPKYYKYVKKMNLSMTPPRVYYSLVRSLETACLDTQYNNEHYKFYIIQQFNN